MFDYTKNNLNLYLMIVLNELTLYIYLYSSGLLHHCEGVFLLSYIILPRVAQCNHAKAYIVVIIGSGNGLMTISRQDFARNNGDLSWMTPSLNTKTLGPTMVIHRSETFESGLFLIDVDPEDFGIRDNCICLN